MSLTLSTRTFIVIVALLVFAVAAVALAAAPAYANNGNVTVDQLERAGYTCFDVGEEPHCAKKAIPGSTPTVNVMVFNSDGLFAGTEILWRADIYANGTPPCPQDEILYLGFAFACHHYGH